MDPHLRFERRTPSSFIARASEGFPLTKPLVSRLAGRERARPRRQKVADPGSSRPTAILPRLIHSYPTRILLQLLPISLLQPTRPPRDPSPFSPFPHATSASCAAGSRPTEGIPPL